MTEPHSTNGGRQQNWIDNLQVPEELDYIKRLQAMNLDQPLFNYWLAMEIFRARRETLSGTLSMAKLTAAVTAAMTAAGTIAAAVYAGLQAISAI